LDIYLSFLNRFKWILLSLILGTILLLGVKIFHLTFDGSYRIWFGKESVILKKYDAFCSTFGSDDTVLVVFTDPSGVLNPKPLQSIHRLTSNLESLTNVSQVSSILNYQYIYASADNVDDIIVENFIENPVTTTLDELESRRDIALNDPMISDYIISKDAKSTMVSVKLTSFAGLSKDTSANLVKSIQDILDKEAELTGYEFHISGGPVTDTALAMIASHDAMVYIPISFLIIIIVLYLFFRTIWGVLIPVVTVLFTSIITLSLYTFMGLELNNFSVNIPIFITAIGIADAVHFYTAWIGLRYEGHSNVDAISHAFKKNFSPMLLTTLTTAIGFGSLITSDIVPMSTLGYTIALGSLAALGLTLFLMPVILLCIKSDFIPMKVRTVRCIIQEMNYASFVVRHDWKILVVSITIALGVGSGIIYTKFDSNSLKYFDNDTQVSEAAYYTMEHLTGPATYEVIIDSGKDDGIKDPEFLLFVDKFDKELKEEFPEVRHTSSLLDVIKRFEDVMNPDHDPSKIVGKTQNINAQYLLLYSLSLPQGMEINDKMDLKQRKLRMSVQADIANSSRSLEIIEWSGLWWDKQGIKANVEGQVAMFAQMQEMVADTLLTSLTQTFAIIGILMFFVIRSIKLLSVFLIPNLLPLMISLGFMGWMGISIDVGIAVASVVVLGLAVDDTVYFFNKYKETRKLGLSATQTFDYILEHSGSAMVFTTVILSAAFSVFLLSDFTPNIHFAVMTISTMFLALLADLLLTPALLNVMDKLSLDRRKEIR
jgi:uncharacterized protein